jgi:superoxide dismutase, Cu-Zn family
MDGESNGEDQMKRNVLRVLAAAMCACLYLASPGELAAADEPERAVAVIRPLQGEEVSGVLHFVPVDAGLEVRGEFWGMEKGSHGFHIHEYGDCRSPRDDSVGGHFLPVAGGSGHGHAHGEENGYLGDLPPIEAGEDGHARYEVTAEGLSLTGERSIIGRSILVHDPDGEMIGCGVIGIGKQP